METWCGDEGSMGNSWDQEEEVEIGMWSNSQQDNRSHDQNTWNYKNKGSNKVCLFSLSIDVPPKYENNDSSLLPNNCLVKRFFFFTHLQF